MDGGKLPRHDARYSLRIEVGFVRPKPLPPEISGDSVRPRFNPIFKMKDEEEKCLKKDGLGWLIQRNGIILLMVVPFVGDGCFFLPPL